MRGKRKSAGKVLFGEAMAAVVITAMFLGFAYLVLDELDAHAKRQGLLVEAALDRG